MTSPSATPAQARAIRRRLLERVADTEDSHLTVPAGAAGWQPFGDGVQIKVLHENAGILSYLLKLAPGARLEAHRHPADEECIVLEGVLRVGSQIEVGPGGFHLARAGSLHASISTATGATIFLRGAEPHVDQLLV
ncbi:MAG TPA: cupin domain-containing protein [Roseateles sp.]